jgi:hypothetical protein
MNLDSQDLVIVERGNNMVLCFHPHFLMRDFTCATLWPAKLEYIRYHIVEFLSIARHTHVQTRLVVTFDSASYVHCRCLVSLISIQLCSL